jgi:hypothetical protein
MPAKIKSSKRKAAKKIISGGPDTPIVQATNPEPSTKRTKCNALNVGHKSCHCGGPDCGANIGGRGR